MPQAPTSSRRTVLAAFLRSTRARISPEDVGVPPGFRRRTPGLRREEVAQLSGVGVTWYTWLEQGRAINVSDQVLESIARTLPRHTDEPPSPPPPPPPRTAQPRGGLARPPPPRAPPPPGPPPPTSSRRP